MKARSPSASRQVLRWSPSRGNQDDTNTHEAHALDLFQRGIRDALSKKKARNPGKRASASRSSRRKSPSFERKFERVMVGPSVREFAGQFQNDLTLGP